MSLYLTHAVAYTTRQVEKVDRRDERCNQSDKHSHAQNTCQSVRLCVIRGRCVDEAAEGAEAAVTDGRGR